MTHAEYPGRNATANRVPSDHFGYHYLRRKPGDVTKDVEIPIGFLVMSVALEWCGEFSKMNPSYELGYFTFCMRYGACYDPNGWQRLGSGPAAVVVVK